MKILSFDPGETTGWAYQDETDNDYPKGILGLGQLKGLVELDDFLRAWDLEKKPVDVLVIEGFRNYNMKANFGSENETSQAFGIIRVWGLRNKLREHLYYSKDISTVAKIVGLDPYKAGPHKATHWVFAANYGRHYLIKAGKAKSALQLKGRK